MPYNIILLSIANWIYLQFQTEQVQSIYFYYYLLIFIGFILSLLFSWKEIKKTIRGVKKGTYAILGAVLLLFALLELIFVKPTHMLYNDEYIYVSIAKIMLTEHLAAVCSFSNATMCVSGTAGFIHQPLGWPFLLSLPSSIFGVNFAVAYSMEFVFALLAIVLIFYVSYLLFHNERTSVLAGAILAFTPIFMRYALTNVLDIPALTFLLLSVFLLLCYMETKSTKIGIASIFSIAYMLSIKVDMISALGIIFLIVLFDEHGFKGKNARRDLFKFLILLAVGFVVILPDLLYIVAATQVSFGAPVGQSNFGLSYLKSNLVPNILFWFGRYDSVYVSVFNSYYYDEFPITFSIFSIVGFFFLFRSKKYRLFFILALWFLTIFVFYTSYYAGGVLYSAGDDVRYFIDAFPVVALTASYSFFSILKYIENRSHLSYSKKRLIAAFLLIILFIEAFWLFFKYVTIPPLHIYPFAAERYDEALILQNYQKIPSNCFVLTFKPPLWYILNRGNIYAGWITDPRYMSKLLNMSNGCLYFDYSVSCYINFTGPPNTEQQCNQVVKTFKMYPIAETHLDNYSWNISMYIYKITGFNNTNSTLNRG